VSLFSVAANWWTLSSITRTAETRTLMTGTRSLWVVDKEITVEHVSGGVIEQTTTSESVDDVCQAGSGNPEVASDCQLNLLVRLFTILVEPCAIVAFGCDFFTVFRPKMVVMYVGVGFAFASAFCSLIAYIVASSMDLGGEAEMDGAGAIATITTVVLAIISGVLAIMSLTKDDDNMGDDEEEENGPQLEPVTPKGPRQVTRQEVIEYMDMRYWWGQGVQSLLFTVLLWAVFLAFLLKSLSSHTALGFGVNTALTQHIKEIQAHPSLSGVEVLQPEDVAVPCRCICQSATMGTPPEACGHGGEGVLEFMGHPLRSDALTLLQSVSPQFESEEGSALFDELRWEDITTVEDAWFWFEHGLLPDLAAVPPGVNTTSGTMYARLLQRNVIVGGVRVRQRRKQLGDCNVGDKIRGVYGSQCRTSDSATGSYLPEGVGSDAWSQAMAAGFHESADEVGAFDAFFDVERSLSDSLRTAEFLHEANWLDAASSSFELQMPFFNADAGLFGVMRLNFELPASGGVKREIRVQVIAEGGNFDAGAILLLLVWVLLILVMLVQEVRQCRSMAKRGQFKRYISSPVNIMDWASIAFGLIMVILWIILLAGAGSLPSDIVAVPRGPISDNDLAAFRDSWTMVLDDMLGLEATQRWLQAFIFWYTTLITMRFLKAFAGQQRMALLGYSMIHLAWDVFYFLTIFLTAFLNYTLGGHILFGPHLAAWSTLGGATNSTVRILLGAFDFEDLYAVAPVSATIWFWSFLLSVILVFMNLFLAIVIEHFAATRNKINHSLGLLDELKEWFREYTWRWQWGSEQDGWKGALRADPYSEVYENLANKAGLSETVRRQANDSCLGLHLGLEKLGEREMDGLALPNPSLQADCSVAELRKLGADAFVANRLIDEARRHADDKKRPPTTKDLLSNFVQALTNSRQRFEEVCDSIEETCGNDEGDLIEALDNLEDAVLESLKNFAVIRVHGVKTHAATEPDRTVLTRVPVSNEQVSTKMVEYHDVGSDARKGMMGAARALTQLALEAPTTGLSRRGSAVSLARRGSNASMAAGRLQRRGSNASAVSNASRITTKTTKSTRTVKRIAYAIADDTKPVRVERRLSQQSLPALGNGDPESAPSFPTLTLEDAAGASGPPKDNDSEP